MREKLLTEFSYYDGEPRPSLSACPAVKGAGGVAIDFQSMRKAMVAENKRRGRVGSDLIRSATTYNDSDWTQQTPSGEEATNGSTECPLCEDPGRLESSFQAKKFDLQAYRVGAIPSVYYIHEFLPSMDFAVNAIIPWLQSRPEVSDDLVGRQDKDEFAPFNAKWKVLRHAKRRVMVVQKQPVMATNVHHNGFCVVGNDETTKGGAFLNDCTNSSSRDFPPVLQSIVNALVDNNVFDTRAPPNHILINEYQRGQGILPHTDGPQYLPRTATLSIGLDDCSHSPPLPKSAVIFKLQPRLSSNEIGVKNTTLSAAFISNADNCKTTVKNTARPPERVAEHMEIVLGGNGSLIVFENDAYNNYLHSIDELCKEVTSVDCVNEEQGKTVERGHRVSLTFRHKLSLS